MFVVVEDLCGLEVRFERLDMELLDVSPSRDLRLFRTKGEDMVRVTRLPAKRDYRGQRTGHRASSGEVVESSTE